MGPGGRQSAQRRRTYQASSATAASTPLFSNATPQPQNTAPIIVKASPAVSTSKNAEGNLPNRNGPTRENLATTDYKPSAPQGCFSPASPAPPTPATPSVSSNLAPDVYKSPGEGAPVPRNHSPFTPQAYPTAISRTSEQQKAERESEAAPSTSVMPPTSSSGASSGATPAPRRSLASSLFSAAEVVAAEDEEEPGAGKVVGQAEVAPLERKAGSAAMVDEAAAPPVQQLQELRQQEISTVTTAEGRKVRERGGGGGEGGGAEEGGAEAKAPVVAVVLVKDEAPTPVAHSTLTGAATEVTELTEARPSTSTPASTANNKSGTYSSSATTSSSYSTSSRNSPNTVLPVRNSGSKWPKVQTTHNSSNIQSKSLLGGTTSHNNSFTGLPLQATPSGNNNCNTSSHYSHYSHSSHSNGTGAGSNGHGGGSAVSSQGAVNHDSATSTIVAAGSSVRVLDSSSSSGTGSLPTTAAGAGTRNQEEGNVNSNEGGGQAPDQQQHNHNNQVEVVSLAHIPAQEGGGHAASAQALVAAGKVSVKDRIKRFETLSSLSSGSSDNVSVNLQPHTSSQSGNSRHR